MDITEILQEIRSFRDERDWMQFHNPKDLAAAISIESSELLELFLWKTDEQTERELDSKRDAIADEIADIAIYLFELADNLGIELFGAMQSKLQKNAAKYPVDKAKGSSRKYTDL